MEEKVAHGLTFLSKLEGFVGVLPLMGVTTKKSVVKIR